MILARSVSVTINGGFGGQPSPPNSPTVLAYLAVGSALQAKFGAAQTFGIACLLNLDQNMTDGVTFDQKLWKGGNCLAGAW